MNILFWLIMIPVGLFLGLYLYYTRYTFAYWLWRITGGVGRLVRFNEAESLPELLGLSNPHPMTVDQTFTVWMPKPEFEEASCIDLAFSPEISFSLDVSKYKDPLGIRVGCNKVFFVKSKKIRFGCCGKYPLAKAMFFGRKFGGDPKCGGGMKAFWPPFFQRKLEISRLRNILVKQPMQVFVLESSKGSHCRVYDADNENLIHGYATFYVGDVEAIMAHAAEKKLKLRPLSVTLS